MTPTRSLTRRSTEKTEKRVFNPKPDYGETKVEKPIEVSADFSQDVHRIEGMTAIGEMQFSAPLFTQLSVNLWIGGTPTTVWPPVFPPGVQAIVNLYKWGQYDVPSTVGPDDYTEVTMYDSAEQPVDREQVYGLAAWAYKRIMSGKVTLIHCQAGLNRSSLITVLVMTLMGYSVDDAITELRTKRSDACLINPAFETWLRENA